jgi:hypothetical protein
MIELYKRFRLSTKEYIIALVDAQIEYTLPDDCMWLISAYGEVPENTNFSTYELSINNEDDPLSVNTVGWNSVQVPITLTGSYISLIYAAGPAVTSYARVETVVGGVTISAGSYWAMVNGVATVSNILPIPVQFIEPLLHYIGYRSYGAMNGSIEAENSTHYTRFDASCKRIEQMGMITNDNLDMHYRVHDKGYV